MPMLSKDIILSTFPEEPSNNLTSHKKCCSDTSTWPQTDLKMRLNFSYIDFVATTKHVFSNFMDFDPLPPGPIFTLI